MRMFTFGLVLSLTAAAHAAPEPMVSLEHGAPVGFIAISADGKTLASGGGSGAANIRLWDLGEREEIVEIDVHRAGITGLAFTPDGKYLASCGWDAQVYLWEVATGREVRSFAGHEEGVTSLAISPDGRLLVTGSIDGVARLFDLATGKERYYFSHCKRGKWDRVVSVAFSADGTLVATSEDHEPRIRFWDVEKGKEVHNPGPSKKSPQARRVYDGIRDFSAYRGNFVPDHHRFAQGSRGIQLRQFGGYPVRSFDHFAPDGHSIAYGLSMRLMFLEAATGQDRLDFRRWQYVSAVTFAADGRTIASAEGKEGAIHLWKVEDLVGVKRPQGKISADQLEMCWSYLARDAVNAYRASWQLSFSPDQAVPFLVDQALDQQKIEPKVLDALIADLDGPTFAVRQRAAAKLDALGPPALAALRKVLAGKPSLEMTQRAERLVLQLEEKIVQEAVRGLRVVETLERIDTPAALAALDKLAQGPLKGGPDVEEAAGRTLARLREQ